MADVLLFVLLSLGVYRVFRLLGRDDLTAGLRLRLPAAIGKPVSCAWCLGSWLSIAAAFAVDRWVTALEPGWYIWAAAIAAAVGLLGEWDE